MALEDRDPRHLLDNSLKENKKLLALMKRVNEMSSITLDMCDKLNERNRFLKTLLKDAYNKGRKYPHDEAGSSFDRWMKNISDTQEVDRG